MRTGIPMTTDPVKNLEMLLARGVEPREAERVAVNGAVQKRGKARGKHARRTLDLRIGMWAKVVRYFRKKLAAINPKPSLLKRVFSV